MVPRPCVCVGPFKMKLGWEAIRAEVLRRIRTRIWAPGALIPSEEALAQEFGCARATVNRALQELANSGVLERKRKAGTRVAALPVRKATLEIPVIRQEIEARGQIYSFRVMLRVLKEPPLAIQARLGLRTTQAMLHLQTLHLAGGVPQVFEDRWLNPSLLPLPEPDFSIISVNEWLVASVAFSIGDIAFSAEPASSREADAMAVPPGTALFITERATWATDTPITWVRLSHAPGYRLHTLL